MKTSIGTNWRRIRVGIVLSAAVAMVGATGGIALADHDVFLNRNHQSMHVWITKSGNTFTCHATNQDLDPDIEYVVLVSYICQYRWNGQWWDFEHPDNNRDVDGFVGGNYTDNPCGGVDGGANLPSGDWKIRAQGDGWTTWSDGETHQFGAPLATSATYYEAHCTG